MSTAEITRQPAACADAGSQPTALTCDAENPAVLKVNHVVTVVCGGCCRRGEIRRSSAKTPAQKLIPLKQFSFSATNRKPLLQLPDAVGVAHNTAPNHGAAHALSRALERLQQDLRLVVSRGFFVSAICCFVALENQQAANARGCIPLLRRNT
jgi:hypothetical protein